MSHILRRRELRPFAIIWLGQVGSLVGSALTGFALGVWLFQRSGAVTDLALNALSATLPMALLSPLAGALVDRHHRRALMIASDCAAATVTLAIAALALGGRLAPWHVYASTATISAANAVQGPAYLATVSQLVPKEHLGRTSGMTSLAYAASSILAPALGGALLVTIGLAGVIVIDLTTFLLAAVTLLVVRIPRLRSTASRPGRRSYWRDVTAGWGYVAARPGLLGMTLYFAALNLAEGMGNVLRAPLVLSFAPPAALGSVMSVAGVGALAGSLLMSAWGGPRRRIHGLLGFSALAGLCMVLAALRPSVALLGVAYAGRYVCGPLFSGCATAIQQSKVAPKMQGRAFALGSAVRGATLTLVYLAAGPLADGAFEPLMATGGPLAASVGTAIGTGPGRGIALLMGLLGLVTMGVAMVGRLCPRLYRIEDELPDAALPPARGLRAAEASTRGVEA
jgi:MFS transporter, DHA3 family, macrolide efflux protein